MFFPDVSQILCGALGDLFRRRQPGEDARLQRPGPHSNLGCHGSASFRFLKEPIFPAGFQDTGAGKEFPGDSAWTSAFPCGFARTCRTGRRCQELGCAGGHDSMSLLSLACDWGGLDLRFVPALGFFGEWGAGRAYRYALLLGDVFIPFGLFR